MPHNDRLTRAAYATEPLEPRRLLAIQIDPSFGDAGLGLADTGVDGFHGTVMVRELSDGKVLTVTGVGFSEGAGGTNVNAAVARFTADGMPDASFGGGDGVALIPFGDVLADAVLHTDGTVVIVGNPAGRLVVARVTSAGAPDPTFGGGDGIVEVVVAAGDGELFNANGAGLLFDGTVYATGSLRVGGGDDGHLVLARVTTQGNADAGFGGGDGLVVLDRPGFVDYAQVAVDVHGRAVVAMREDDLAVVGRFNDDEVDPTFGDGGFTAFPQSRPGGDLAFSVAIERGGAGVVVGAMGFVGWIDAFGDLETDFSGDGVATLPTGVASGDIVMEVAVDSANRVVGVVDRAVFRLLLDGSPDVTFGAGGVVSVEDFTASAVTVSGNEDNLLFVAGGLITDHANVAVARVAQLPGVVLGPTGVLVVTGEEAGDSITLEAAGDEARLDFNGTVTTYPLADVTGAYVNLLDGDNSLMLALDVDATVRAGAGDDTVTTGNADDDVNAGDGANDVSTGDGNDSITTGAGRDTILTSGADDRDTVQAGAGDDSITTGEGPDFIQAGFGANTVVSNGGDDNIFGGEGADSIDSGAGNDVVLAALGNNTLVAGDGDDIIEGGDDHDSINGGAGFDRLLGGNGNNVVFGGTGDDSIRTGTGADTLWGEIGNDLIKAGFGDDYLNGGASKDRLFGQQGDDTIYAGRNNDALDGGPGSDLLKGWDGNDKLFDRDATADTLDGGLDNDQALFDEDGLDTVLRIETVL